MTYKDRDQFSGLHVTPRILNINILVLLLLLLLLLLLVVVWACLILLI